MIFKSPILRQSLSLIFYLIIFATSPLKVQAQDIPVSVKATFSKMYPKSSSVIWKKMDSLYRASFVVKDIQKQTLFNFSGAWLETRSFITLEALTQVAEKAVVKAYPGCSLEEVVWIQNKGTEYFEVMLITKLDEYTTVNVTSEGLIIEPEN